MGGIFDPPQVGHVALARAARQELPIDRLVVLVAANPGHREVVADADTRLRLARLAFEGIADEIVPEPSGGAHADPAKSAELLGPVLERSLKELMKLKPALLLEERYQKFRKMGVFEKG